MLGKTVANRYKITEEISQDSLTFLCKAQDTTENKPVFITLLKEKARQRPLETLLRFKREQEQISKLNHPNLLKIYSHGEFEGQDYVVSEYCESEPLSKLLLLPQNIGQPLPIDSAVDIILQLSSALDVAHQSTILHQALQPQSILITQDLRMVKLASFGYNLLTDISRITEKEEIISTFGYLSPESSGILRRPIDVRSDIYSLGIIFYRFVTGRLPYTAPDISTLIHEHIAQIPDPPSKLNSQIPPVIENIILRLIAKDPQDRYQSLSGLTFDLMEYQNQRSRGKQPVDFEIARFDKLRQLTFNTRLIGRDKELNVLKSLLDQTKQGKGSLCFVFGEPGIGKSRLVDELRGHIHGLNGLFCGGKCYQYEFRTPYKVISEAADAYIEKIKRLSQEEQQEHIKRIKDALGQLGGEVVKVAPNIIDLIGQPPKLEELEPEKEKIRFLITITNFIASLSTSQVPLLMFLDDLQWVDDGSLEILERVAEKLQNIPALLIVSYRDNEVDQNHPLAQFMKRLAEQNISLMQIPVKSFSLNETAQIICQIFLEKEEHVLPLAQELQERAKGNPFFTLELLHSLVDEGVVSLKEEHYIYDLDKLKSASLPTTIVDAVLKRMKDLSVEEQEIISYASIMGKEIDFKLLAELSNKQTDTILSSIEDGIKNQLLFRDLTGQENIFFMHDRIREAFYKRVSEEDRVPLHKHIAEVLEAQNIKDPGPVLYDLAYHFTQGKVEDKALQYAIPAAHKAKSSYANVLAIELFNSARVLLKRLQQTQGPQYIDVLENLGETYRLAGRFEESLEALKTCETIIPVTDKLHKAQLLSKEGETLFEKGEKENSIRAMESAIMNLGEKIPNNIMTIMLGVTKEFSIQMFHTWFPKWLVRDEYVGTSTDLAILKLYAILARVYYFVDIYKAFYFFLKGLNKGEKIGPCPELALNYIMGIPVWSTFPWVSRAFRDGNKGIKMAQDFGDKRKEGTGWAYLVYGSYIANKTKQGVDYAPKAINLLKGAGEYWDLGVAFAFRNHSSWVMGRLKEYIIEVEEFIKIAKEAKVLQNFGWGLGERSKLWALIGEINEGTISDMKECIELMQKTGDYSNVPYFKSRLAFVYLRAGDYEKAIGETEEAIKLFPNPYMQGAWVADVFALGAQVYLDAIVNILGLSKDKKKQYIKRARWLCFRSSIFSILFKYFLGWSYQVNGTYLWLVGKKGKAIKTLERGIRFLREHIEDNKYRLAYILLEEAKFLLSDNPKDKKAYSNLIEARDLFTEMGCKLDLDTANKLLESISPEGISVDSRTVLTQKRHLDSLLSVTQAIGSIFILDELLQKILEYGLKVTGAERGFLLLYDQAKNLSLKVSSNLEKDLQGLSFSYENYKLSLELINEVQNSKAAVIAGQDTASTSKISTELKTFSVKQAIAVPLQTRDKPIGILYMDNRLAGGTFGKDELELMKG
ncbi:MAG: AAA family ATPase, partial [Candidatus Omnitrophica bacterium]|nr:AAA family ATPase [Candidatus Omnitrophota bacterium]